MNIFDSTREKVNEQLQEIKNSSSVSKNIFDNVSKGFKAVGDFGATIVQAPARASAAFTLDATGQLQFIPTTPLEKIILGTQPIKSASQQYKEAEQNVSTGGIVSPKLSKPIAGVAVFGSLAMDLTPFGGSEKNAAKALVKTKTAEEAIGILSKMGVVEDIAKTYADDVVKVATTKDAKNLINSITKLQSTTRLTDTAKTAIEMQEAPVNKLINAIKQATPVRQEAEALYTAERERRAIAGTKAMKAGGEQGYIAALSKLKGELPKPTFESIKPNFEQADIDSLFSSIQKNNGLDFYDKITTQNGLVKIVEGGGIPTNNELKLLQEVFGEDLVKAVLDKRSTIEKTGESIAATLNIPRAIMSSIDMSAPLRQGLVLTVSKPKQSIPAFKEMFKYFASDKALESLNQSIKAKELYGLMNKSGLAFTDTSKTALGLAGKEEIFMTNYAEKIPIMGRLIKASERAYVGYLNKIRADVFEDIAQNFIKNGISTSKNPEVFTALAEFVNSASGRGSLGKLNNAAPILNGVFFSPRLMASRVNMLNPQWYFKQPPAVRKEAIKSMITTVGAGLTVLGLAKMGGAEVEADPRSTDFGKIKIGDTRIDIWGGFQQWVRLISQVVTGESKSTTTGKISKLSDEAYPYQTRLDKTISFFIGKFAPIPALTADLMRGTTATGEKLELTKESMDRLTPLYIQDIIDVLKEGDIGTALTVGIPAFFGAGTQTYTTKKKNQPSSNVKNKKNIFD